LRNEGTPSLDELMAQNAGDKELVLSERVSRTRGSSSVTAAGAVAHLKERGYWIRRFDHHCFPAMFEELERLRLGCSSLSSNGFAESAIQQRHC
jgi:hypothetical protein